MLDRMCYMGNLDDTSTCAICAILVQLLGNPHGDQVSHCRSYLKPVRLSALFLAITITLETS